MRISFCTTCMDRLFHLKQTYLKNIENMSSYPDAEFILLDYGSKDGLEDWVKANLSERISSGRVAYYRTADPKNWVAAHAKNMAQRLASGDILCNLDSDILMPKMFCEYIESVFSQKPAVIMAFESEDPYGNNGCAGMVIARKEHFYSVNGYDENIKDGWGYDDMNFQFRCRMHNSLELFVPPKVCLCIPHPNEVRTANCIDRNIENTRKQSMDKTERCASDRDYVANRSSSWGVGTVFKNFSNSPICL